MTKKYDDTNRGVLFKNKKETESHPDYAGKINFEGTTLRLAAWIRESKDGKKYMSLSVSEFQAQEVSSEPVDRIDDDETINLDDIPF